MSIHILMVTNPHRKNNHWQHQSKVYSSTNDTLYNPSCPGIFSSQQAQSRSQRTCSCASRIQRMDTTWTLRIQSWVIKATSSQVPKLARSSARYVPSHTCPIARRAKPRRRNHSVFRHSLVDWNMAIVAVGECWESTEYKTCRIRTWKGNAHRRYSTGTVLLRFQRLTQVTRISKLLGLVATVTLAWPHRCSSSWN